MKKTAKFVLLLDADSVAIRQAAMNLAGNDGYLLIARSPAAAVEFAKQYQPAYAVLGQSQASIDGKSFQDLVREFSPQTEIVLISNGALGAVGQSA